MAILAGGPIRSLDDLRAFEAAMPLDARLPEHSVLDVLEGAARQHGDRVAITMVLTGAPHEQPRRVTYADLLGLVRRSANLFHALGGPRPGVAYMLPTTVETYATLWGAETAGYAVPINFLLQPEHIAELLAASGARILVALGPHPALDIWQKALRLRDLVPGLTLVRLAMPGAPPPEPGVVDLVAALHTVPADRLEFDSPGRDGDVAAYFHTGGTTGVPRLVAHTHRGQLVAALGGAVLGDFRGDDVVTGTLPLFHVGGTIFLSLSVMLAGAQLVVTSPSGLRNPAMVANFWRIVGRYRCTLVGAVPTGLGAVLESPIGPGDLASVRAGFCGAASLPPAVAERFKQVTGKRLYEVYGMTEASGLIAIDPVASDGGETSVGFRLPYTEVVVRRLGEGGWPGEACAIGEIGVVVVRGPHVSPGYRNPEHDAGMIDSGTLNSGDLGYIDDTGRLHIAGRSKDLIIRSAHNIDPLMIENAMAAHPAVAVVAAVGQPDAYAGELPVVYLSLRPGASATLDELHSHARATIAERPAWPKEIRIVEVVPVTTVGKIYKPALRCDAATHEVTRLLGEQFGLAGAVVEAREGGRRGLRVSVTLPEAAQARRPEVQQALAAYLFEAFVSVAPPAA